MESSRQIEERASQWLLRRESKEWSDLDRRHLEQWLEASVFNRVAFLRLEAGWQQVDRIKALGAGFAPRAVPDVAELARAAHEASGWRVSEQGGAGIDESSGLEETPIDSAEIRIKGRRGKRALVSLAASILILLTGALIVYQGPLAGQRFSTPVGGVSSVPLSDGSSVTLNTASRIRVRMSDRERRVDLTQGEVFFDVAPDPARPFIVQAGARRIVVLGTKFSVRLNDDDVRVVVTEGMVSVDNAAAGPKRVSRLSAGTVATASSAVIETHSSARAQTEELLSWRFGYVVFNETTLADAVAEFKRYDNRDIVVRDPQIASIRLTGKFRANNLDAFVRLLESTSPVHAEYSPERIVLTSANGVGQQR